MSDKNNGGPAFPVSKPSIAYGMSKREYFALNIMASVLSSGQALSVDGKTTSSANGYAEFACRMADKLIEELEK
jgi:hypothetical protein